MDVLDEINGGKVLQEVITMTKLEREKCAEMLSRAIDYAKQANDESKAAWAAHRSHDALTENMKLQLCQQHNGFAEGIHDMLVMLDFKHPDMDKLEKLLYE